MSHIFIVIRPSLLPVFSQPAFLPSFRPYLPKRGQERQRNGKERLYFSLPFLFCPFVQLWMGRTWRRGREWKSQVKDTERTGDNKETEGRQQSGREEVEINMKWRRGLGGAEDGHRLTVRDGERRGRGWMRGIHSPAEEKREQQKGRWDGEQERTFA